MTDHADTIRRYFDRAFDQDDAENRAAFDALSALLAERQQAIDRCQHWRESSASFEVETYELGRQLRAGNRRTRPANEAFTAQADLRHDAQVRCEQAIDERDLLRAARVAATKQYREAIDALRKIAATETGFTYPQEIARAALVSLGEKPTP